MMDPRKTISWLTLILLLFSSCSVISKDIRSQAEPRLPFKEMARHPDKYEGRIVIIGGYILENKASKNRTTLTVLQSPLTLEDEPKSKDYSEGRFIVTHNGFLDPEVYAKDRKITVGGKIAVCGEDAFKDCYDPYPRVESSQIYLWPKYNYYYRYPYPAYYFDGFYFYGLPHHHPHLRYRYYCR